MLHLIVQDPDDFYPFGFVMRVHTGENYTSSHHTITPAPNFHGTLIVNVSVNDGYHDSNVYQLKVTVNPVNDAPVIKAQAQLSTIEQTPLAIRFTDLTVEDPDNTYPNGFSLQVQNGPNYVVSGTTITPNAGFTGTLTVPVTVSDGLATSAPFNLSVTVIPANKKPVITGQVALSTAKNKPITIELSHLKVDDPDSKFPDEFTLTIHSGPNYTASGKTVTPGNNFVGTLSVSVSVNDGHSSSDVWGLKIDVKDQLVITGQVPMEREEDVTFPVELAHLQVYDPENKFPAGYSIAVQPGERYTFSGVTITPEKDYYGALDIGVKVTNGSVTSPLYTLRVTLLPVNDPPGLANFNGEPVKYTIGGGPRTIYEDAQIVDPDDAAMMLAEIGFTDGFEAGSDVLSFAGAGNIRAVFDSDRGILSLIGQGTLDEYSAALKSVTYEYINLESPTPVNKLVYVKLNDGKSVSELFEREIVSGENFELDIPTAFSPNNDQTNDTWKIKPHRFSERYNNTIVRVFNERGLIVYEAKGFQSEWDGRFNGKDLPEGTYLYAVDLNLNYETKRITGSVSIFR